MIPLVDTNVLIDVLAERSPFEKPAAEIWALVEAGKLRAVVSAVSFATIFYYARKLQGRDQALAACERIRRVFDVVAVDAEVIDLALASGMHDFEDALQAFSGVRGGATHVVSRDATGFRDGPLPVLTPEQFVAVLNSP